MILPVLTQFEDSIFIVNKIGNNYIKYLQINPLCTFLLPYPYKWCIYVQNRNTSFILGDKKTFGLSGCHPHTPLCLLRIYSLRFLFHWTKIMCFWWNHHRGGLMVTNYRIVNREQRNLEYTLYAPISTQHRGVGTTFVTGIPYRSDSNQGTEFIAAQNCRASRANIENLKWQIDRDLDFVTFKKLILILITDPKT